MDIGIVVLIITILAMCGIGYFIYNPPAPPASPKLTAEQKALVKEFKAGQASAAANAADDNRANNELTRAQAAAAIVLPRQVITDLGYPDTPGHLVRGWMDVIKQGASNDYCSYIGVSPGEWKCALAGGKGYTAASEYGSSAVRVPVPIK